LTVLPVLLAFSFLTQSPPPNCRQWIYSSPATEVTQPCAS